MFSRLLYSIKLQTGTRWTWRLCLSPVATITWLLSLVFLDELIIRLGVRSRPSCVLLLSRRILELFETFLSDYPISLKPYLSLRIPIISLRLVVDSRLCSICCIFCCCCCCCIVLGLFLDRKGERSRVISESNGCAAYYG